MPPEAHGYLHAMIKSIVKQHKEESDSRASQMKDMEASMNLRITQTCEESQRKIEPFQQLVMLEKKTQLVNAEKARVVESLEQFKEQLQRKAGIEKEMMKESHRAEATQVILETELAAQNVVSARED